MCTSGVHLWDYSTEESDVMATVEESEARRFDVALESGERVGPRFFGGEECRDIDMTPGYGVLGKERH